MMRLRMSEEMKLRRVIGMMAGMVLVASCVAAQGVQLGTPQQRGGPTGQVTGTVISGDTQQPARFVQVTLESTALASASEQDDSRGFGGMSGTRTEVDGTFLATGVAPGDYYVTAWAPGYMTERAILQAGVNAGSDPGALLARIPVVHVAADSTSTVTVTMQRGGTISGRILWEDGSPAAGLTVQAVSSDANVALPAALAGIQSPGAQTTAVTDDRGGFRVSGLPSGNYVVMTIIQNRGFGGFQRGGQVSPIRVYGSGFFHKADAKPINVRAGDERSDVRMVIDLHVLRMVTGHATANSPGLSVASGRVNLTDPTDPSLQMQGAIDANGQFVVKYVPPGTYTMQVTGASTVAASQPGVRGSRGSSSTPGVTFQTLSQPVTVGDTDLSGLALTLTASQ
jgi:hypothetical protein